MDVERRRLGDAARATGSGHGRLAGGAGDVVLVPGLGAGHGRGAECGPGAGAGASGPVGDEAVRDPRRGRDLPALPGAGERDGVRLRWGPAAVVHRLPGVRPAVGAGAVDVLRPPGDPPPVASGRAMKPYWAGDGIALYLGDCRKVTGWLAADVLVTDPPYGANYTSHLPGLRDPIQGDKD